MKVELRNIHKHFGAVHANNDVSLVIPPGTIQGILGENGAGKSTLMKILSGFIQADSGEILLDDQRIEITDPSNAIHHGIGMLHQDPLDFPPMRVIDNFLTGQPGGLFPSHAVARREMLELQKQFGFNLDPDSYVDMLTVGERQQLEILRLLWLGARVLILDEPTTGISALQKEKLFDTLRTLADQGKTAIFVSHKLEDVEVLCDRVAVLQRGRLVGEICPPYETDRLVEMMFGKVISMGDRDSCVLGGPAMRITNMMVDLARLQIRDVNLTVERGEVIGLAGMEGSGQRELLRACAGLIRPAHGHIWVGEQELTGKNYHSFMKAGVSYVPAARLEEGLIPGLTLTEHFILAEEQKGLLIDREKAVRATQQGIEGFNIRGIPANRIESLSGGNQQRALLALQRDPLDVLLMEHPTRGLDIESAIYIWSKLKERCRLGTSILFISADLDEILQYSDRILVFFSGRLSHPLPAESTTVEQLGQLIGGKGFAEIVGEE